jgi:hypothetical protein
MGATVLSESDRIGIDVLVETEGARMMGGIHSVVSQFLSRRRAKHQTPKEKVSYCALLGQCRV